MTDRILVADDEPSIRMFLREALSDEGHEITEVDNGEDALRALTERDFDVAFLDIRMPGPSGLELLDRCSQIGATTSLVIMTAQNTMENAVEAMKRGAFDYLVKPFGLTDLQALVARILGARALESDARSARRGVAGTRVEGERLVGRSSALLEVFKTVGRVARSDVSVLIAGESGTGKELVARAIHAASPRAEKPFVAINAAAIPRELLESELFGHERGAFTGAIESRLGRFREADGGTLFLDEIGDMPVDLQSKLLRVLQTEQVTPVGGQSSISVDVRILSATHRRLDESVAEGGFREDLLYRLRVVPIDLPALRERPEDIDVLATHFVARCGRGAELSEACLEFLKHHDWPGNVRELENAVKRAIVLSASEVLTPEDFAFLQSAKGATEAVALEELVAQEVEAALDTGESEIYRHLIGRVERPLLARVLRHTGGNQIKAAAMLGINRNTLRKKIGDLGIEMAAKT
jgi:two-component system nitrogen regulation response regulator GlnG